MPKRLLTVSIMQMPVSDSTKDNLAYIEESVDKLMTQTLKPELVIGVEFGITKSRPEPIPGKAIGFLSGLARRYGIYFIPGTMLEKSSELGKVEYYNSCPVFGPDGEIIDVYRKRAPFKLLEKHIVPGKDDNYCIFEIKGIKVGVLICYDQFFPEIPRSLALLGAELMVCPSYELVPYAFIPDVLPRARALENDAYYIWTCGTGTTKSGTACGYSTLVDPEGMVVHKCGDQPELYTITLDFKNVSIKRPHEKRINLNSNLEQLRDLSIRPLYNDKLEDAPVYRRNE